uniref:ORF46 n=1 Tax=Malaco herpesvirus 4 TaxID=3031800 RepID=A0AA48SF01_9VIRU|nr:TPA_asm: ORF46 [Malaco herpesvirus 4]
MFLYLCLLNNSLLFILFFTYKRIASPYYISITLCLTSSNRTTTYRANAIMNNGGMIVRSNYGVILNHVGQIINGESFYRYTYAIDLSSYAGAYAPFPKCHTKRNKRKVLIAKCLTPRYKA